MVKDINTVSASSDPFSFVAFKGETFFRANDGEHGIEWFRTDGTPGGTSMLVDLNPGTGSSFPGGISPGDPREVATAAVLGDALLFLGFAPGGAGAELYRTDGTAAGTVLLKNIHPTGNSVPQRFMAVGDTLYFTADDGTNGRQLWKTDGTADGTVRVSNIPNDSPALAPTPLALLGGRLVFSARSDDGATLGRELWITDGTPAGTTLLKNIHPSGSSSPGFTANGTPDVAVVGDHLYFAATDALHGRELWRTDGTPEGTAMVAELVPGPGSSSPTNLTAVNGNLYFTATLPPGVGGTSGVYWKDPTGAISEISPQTQFGSGVGFPGSAGNVGGVFYLGAWFNNSAVLFKHDPATATPATNLTLVKGLAQATNWHFSAGPILDVGGKALLLAQGPTGSNTIHLWRSDGTPQGTEELATFPDPQIPTSELARWNIARGADNLLYFAGATPAGGTEPVRTDGTAAGTFGLGEINGNTHSSNPSAVVYLGGNRWVFNAENPLNGRELWVTNGTESGTSLVKDIATGSLSSFRAVPFHMTPALNGRTYFAATSVGATDSIDTELWTSDGTPEGTYRLKTYPPNFGPRGFAALNGKMYFTAGTSERGLWETDGTEAGTRLVFPLDRITFGPLIHVGGLLYFSTHRADTGSELWKTDGTAAGTRRVSAFSQEPTGTASAPAAMGGAQYYIGPIDAERHGLWRADGTPGAAALVKELPAGFPAAPFTHLLVAGDRLLLSRGAPYERVESDVWVSDGTPDGTAPLASLVPALEDFAGDTRFLGDVQLLGAGGAAYFFGDADPGDPGIWRTDGTAAGTRLLRFFPPQTPLSALGVIDGQVYFSAGDQLWRTDGTEAGTVPVQDAPPVGDSDRGDFTFFAGSDPAHGTELWARPREDTEVYVRGSAWAGAFNTYLQHNGLGDFGYGYRVDNKVAGDVLPWVKLDQIVVRYPPGTGTPGGPTPGLVTIQSQRGAAYAVTRVNAVPGDPLAFVFALDRPLGGDGPDETRNGDRLTLSIAGAGPNGTSLALRLNVLQGDVNADGNVLATDYADVKKKFFRGTAGPFDAANPAVNYSPFHDVDGSGVILATDYAEVKKRFFHSLPAEPAAPAGATLASRRSRPVTREWFASASLIA
jgi:ELWxxDGT repeat protein